MVVLQLLLSDGKATIHYKQDGLEWPTHNFSLSDEGAATASMLARPVFDSYV